MVMASLPRAEHVTPMEDWLHMATGTVKWFSDDKGFGFITPDEGSRDLFVHHTGIVSEGYRTLAEGSKVSYEEEMGDKGPKPSNVEKIWPADHGSFATGPAQAGLVSFQ